MTDCYYQFHEKGDIYRGIIQTINWPLLRPLFIDTPVKIGKKWEKGGEGYSREIISSCFKSGPLGDALPSLRPLSYFIFPFHFPFVPSTLPIPPSLRFFSILFLFLLSAPSPLPPLFFYYFFSPATFDSEISLLILTAGVFIFELSETGETVTVRNRVSKSRLIFRSICQLGGYLPSLLLEVRTNLEGEKEGEI